MTKIQHERMKMLVKMHEGLRAYEQELALGDDLSGTDYVLVNLEMEKLGSWLEALEDGDLSATVADNN